MIKKLSVLIKVKHIYFMPFLLLLVFSHYAEATSNIHSEATDRKKTIQILLQAIKETTDKIPQSFDNPNALAKELKNVEAVHQWVHEHTVLTPYVGSLKGAKGVMIDREGNSLDRSLLMAELLKQKGYKVRLARTQISQQQAEILFEETLKFPENLDHLVPSTELLQQKINEIIPSDFLAKLDNESMGVTDLLYDRFEISAEALLPVAKKIRKHQVEDQIKIEKLQQIENLFDHWWVQAKTNGQWQDFDSVLTEPGKRLSNSVEAFDVDNIPEDLIHKVTIEIVAEVTDFRSGKSENHTLLKVPLIASDLRDQPIGLSFVPTDGMVVKEIREIANNKEKFLSRLQNIKWWLPVLRINNENIFNKSVSISGVIREKKDLQSRSSNVNSSTKKIAGAFAMLNTTIAGAIPSKSKQPEKNATNENSAKELTGIWLTFKITPSNSRLKEIRRIIYQKSKKSLQDRALKLLSKTSISIISNKSNEMHVSRNIQKRHQYFYKMLVENEIRQDAAIEMFHLNLIMFNYLQNKLGAGFDGLYIYEPQIYMTMSGLTLEKNDNINDMFSFDIVKNEFKSRLIEGIDPFESKAIQGIMDTVIESTFSSDYGLGENASITLQADKDLNGQIYIQNIEDKNFFTNYYKNKGYLLVSNKKMGNRTYWRIDPETGDILGMTDQGMGGYMEKIADTAITLAVWVDCVDTWKTLYDAIPRTAKKTTLKTKFKGLVSCMPLVTSKTFFIFFRLANMTSHASKASKLYTILRGWSIIYEASYQIIDG